MAQVGEAIVQMDQATQKNAALVEEMAAAASSLKVQAQDLVGTVAVFKLASGNSQQRGMNPAFMEIREAVSRRLPFNGTPKRSAQAFKSLTVKPKALA